MRVLVIGGQNHHAVSTTGKIRAQLGIRPRFTLALDWYLREGLDRREIDFSQEDTVLRCAG